MCDRNRRMVHVSKMDRRLEMSVTNRTTRLDRVVRLIFDRAEIERQLLVAIVELFQPSPRRPDSSTGFAQPAGKSKAALLTVNDFCKRARISRATLYRMIRDGQVSYYKVGGRTLFDERHLTDFLDRHQLSATPARPTKRGSPKR